jgi:hypothetical protein
MRRRFCPRAAGCDHKVAGLADLVQGVHGEPVQTDPVAFDEGQRGGGADERDGQRGEDRQRDEGVGGQVQRPDQEAVRAAP